MVLPASYANGFAPRDGQPLYPELWRGCVGAWAPCLGPTGSTLRDWSGYGNHGALTGMVAGEDWVTTDGRYALDFDGNVTKDDEIIIATASTRFSLPTLRNRVTVCGWIKNRSFPAYSGGATNLQELWQHGPNNTTNGEWYLTQFNQKAYFQIWQGGPFTAIGAVSLAANRWYHICGTWDGATIRVYVDGRLDGSGAAAVSPADLAATTRIGRLGFSGAEYSVDGFLDDMRVYNRALGASEVQTLASRRGIAYDLAPRRRSRIFTGGFRAYWAARKAQIIGGGL